MNFSQFHRGKGGNRKFKQPPNSVIIQTKPSGSKNIWNQSDAPLIQGTINNDGTDVKQVIKTRLRTDGYIEAKPNTTYTVTSNIARGYVFEYDSSKEFIYVNANNVWYELPLTFTTTDETKYIRLNLAHKGSGNITVDEFEWLRIDES